MFRRYPFLRLLLPLAIGIATACYLPFSLDDRATIWVIAVAVMPLIAVVMFFIRRWNHAFGSLLFVFMFLSGAVLTFCNLRGVSSDFDKEEHAYCFVVDKQPEEKEKTVLCESVIESEYLSADSLILFVGKKRFLLYLAKDSLSMSVRRGDRLLARARLAPPTNQPVPQTFDYATYLRNHGISGTSYIASDKWTAVGCSDETTLVQHLSDMREDVSSLYVRLGFEGDALAVLSSLTLGDKSDLSDEVKEVYSSAGVSHILAISGLHIGLVYGIMLLLLVPVWRRLPRLKIPLLLSAVATLWLFALFTGFSPSVVRAVLMFSLLTLSGMVSGNPGSLNTLMTAAFVMLVFKPLWLFDVGFQLSFAAVASILLFQPLLSSALPVENKLLVKVRDLLSVAVAAQIGTAPLVMFYFHRFPLHFLVSNLWVLPLVTVIMYLAVLMLMLSPLPVLQQIVADILSKLINVQNTALQSMSEWSVMTVDNIYLEKVEVVLWFVAVACLYLFCKFHSARNTLLSLSSLFLIVTVHCTLRVIHAPEKNITFFAVNGNPVAHCVWSGSESWMVCGDSIVDKQYMLKAIKPYLSKTGISEPEIVNGDFNLPRLNSACNIIHFAGKRICFLNDDRWDGAECPSLLPVDILFVSKGFRGHIANICRLFTIKQVIVSPSLSDFYTDRMLEECDTLSIPCSLLADSGPITVTLDN